MLFAHQFHQDWKLVSPEDGFNHFNGVSGFFDTTSDSEVMDKMDKLGITQFAAVRRRSTGGYVYFYRLEDGESFKFYLDLYRKGDEIVYKIVGECGIDFDFGGGVSGTKTIDLWYVTHKSIHGISTAYSSYGINLPNLASP